MFRVFDQEFEFFNDVINWAWDNYKIDVAPDCDFMLLSTEEMHGACRDLECLISITP